MNNCRPSSAVGLAIAASLILLGPSRHAGVAVVVAQDNARQIVEEAQKRGSSRSQRYEGLLQTFEANGKSSEKKAGDRKLVHCSGFLVILTTL